MIFTRAKFWLSSALAVFVLAGCASDSSRAPVVDHGAPEKTSAVPIVESVTTVTHVTKSVQPDKDWRPQTYVVQKGDTLYAIAFNHGLDYHELAQINNIQNPDVILAGQELHLFTSVPMAVKPKVPAAKLVESKPVEIPLKESPKVALLPYSGQAVAEIQKMQEISKPAPVAVAVVEPKPDAQTETPPEPQPASDSKPEAVAESAAVDDTLEWGMPTSGKVVGEFSESANRKGIDISGKQGQTIVASAAGKVVYSGSGLRGYGKLVIIKHNNTFLSAYAHNDLVLVKEGETVTKGQKIAEMGNSDSDQVKLHFEIRKFGKPVDPAKLLPLVKS